MTEITIKTIDGEKFNYSSKKKKKPERKYDFGREPIITTSSEGEG